jgi:DNA transposition AAA+ family ATPase
VALADEKYMLLTTFRRDGTPVSTPVQPSDGRGRVKAGTTPVEGTARLVSDGELDAIRERVKAKYGFQTKLTKALATIWGTARGKRIPYGDRGVVISVAQSQS